MDINTNKSQNYLSLIRRHTALLSIAFLAVFTGNLGQSFFIGLFQAPISQHLNLSAGEFGNIYAVITISGGFLIMYFGPKVDTILPKRYALLVLMTLTIGLLLLTLSSSWIIGVLGLGLLRLCGQGLMTHLGSTLAAREFTTDRGKALGLIGLAMPSGEIILPPLTALLLIWLDWQQVWWCLFAFILLPWLYLFVFADWPKVPQTKKDIHGYPIDIFNPIKELYFWLLIPMLLVLPMTLTGIFIYQAQLTLDLHANMATYAMALTAMGLVRFPIALLGGHWVDELGLTLLARFYLLPYAIALLTAALIGGNIGIWVLMLGAGFGMSISNTIGDSLLVRLWGKNHLGKVRSLKSAFMVFSTGITPALLGFLLDIGVRFQTILVGMFIFLITSWLLAQAPIRRAQQLEFNSK